jgi:hypothetical protein
MYSATRSNRLNWPICTGPCRKRVPHFVIKNPDACNYCRQWAICTGPCKKPVPSFVISDPSKCIHCQLLEYPRRGCDTCKQAFSEHKSQTTCSSCTRRLRFLKYLGEMHDDYVIKITFTHDCVLDDDGEVIRPRNITILPAPVKIVNSDIDLDDDILYRWLGTLPKFFTSYIKCSCDDYESRYFSIITWKLREKKKSDDYFYPIADEWKYFA